MFSQTYLQNFFFSFFFYRKQNVWFVTNLMWGLIVQIKNSMTKLTLTKLQRWHLLFLLNKDFFFFFFGPKLSPSSERRIQEGKKEMCKVPSLFQKRKSDCGYKVNWSGNKNEILTNKNPQIKQQFELDEPIGFTYPFLFRNKRMASWSNGRLAASYSPSF